MEPVCEGMCCWVGCKDVDSLLLLRADVVRSPGKMSNGQADLCGGPVRDGEIGNQSHGRIKCCRVAVILTPFGFSPNLQGQSGDRERKGGPVWVERGLGQACVALFRRGDFQGVLGP